LICKANMKQIKPDSSSKSDKNQSQKAIKTKGAPGKHELASTLAGQGKVL